MPGGLLLFKKETMTDPRLIDFDNILNARDFGHYSGAGGKDLRRGKLFRTAHLNKAGDKDLEKLRAMDIGLIVDLRYLSERERQPNKWPEGTATQTLAFDATRTGQAPHEAFMQHDLHKPEDAVAYMMGNYAERPGHKGFQQIFKSTLNHMTGTGDGIIVHCAAGKDRTGTLVALIQALLGVHEDDIMDDYMLTMRAVDIDSMLEPAAKMIGEKFGRAYDPESLRPMFGVREAYLAAALDAMGEPVTYAREHLDFSVQDIDRLRAHYLD